MSKCTIDNQAINACKEGYNAFLELLRERERISAEQNKALADWSMRHAMWTRLHNEQLRKLEAGRQARSSEIWHDNQKYDCSRLPPGI